jgi:hypothetical protein
MKKITILFSAFLLVGLLFSCASPLTENKEKEETKEEPKEATKTEEKKEVPKTAVCKTEEKKEGPDPIITKNCQYGNIQTKSVGYPDMKGRYSYSYELMFDGKKVKNSEIFNKFNWIRVSVQSANYARKINLDHIPSNVRRSMSFIVHNRKSLEEIKNVYDFAKENNIIIRVAPYRPCEGSAPFAGFVSPYIDEVAP